MGVSCRDGEQIKTYLRYNIVGDFFALQYIDNMINERICVVIKTDSPGLKKKWLVGSGYSEKHHKGIGRRSKQTSCKIGQTDKRKYGPTTELYAEVASRLSLSTYIHEYYLIIIATLQQRVICIERT